MKKVKVIVTLIATISVLCLWIMGIWALNLKDFQAPEMMIFLGRFHPLILHMPIGLTVLALLLDLGRTLPKKWSLITPNTTALYGLIVLTTLGTVLHGILLYAGEGYESSELASHHLIRGCIYLTIVAAIFIIKLWFNTAQIRFTDVTMGIIAMIALSISAHDGASLTHGENYLSQYAPPPLKPLLEPEYKKPPPSVKVLSIRDENIYLGVIQPIFDRTCVECHSESKKKGKLSMDSYAELMKGGAGGDILTPYDIENSYFLELIHLPIDDEDHMPPEGKKQPTKEEIAILEWWVGIGSPADGTLASHNPPEDLESDRE